MVVEGDYTVCGKHTMQYKDNVFQNYTQETYIIY